MKAIAFVLEKYGAPLTRREFEPCALAPGELLVSIEAAGICGSDLHMWEGRDPRTPLPIILGHEAVGRVMAVGGQKRDILGRLVREGDRIAWDRGITCGTCFYCVVRKEPYLCAQRLAYGINMSCASPPYLLGGYASHMHLLARTNTLVVPDTADPAELVSASCSGATAAHAVEAAAIRPGDVVVVQGPGPLGLFAIAFARERGAGLVIAAGTVRSAWKLEFAKRFGAEAVVASDEQTTDDAVQERKERILSLTGGRGADVVLECAGRRTAMEEGIRWLAPGGVYAWVGAAMPIGQLPLRIYEDVVRKNVRLQGVWVSDTSHFYQAAQLVLDGRYPFKDIITHRFPLSAADEALQALKRRETLKAVLIPSGE